MAAARGRLVAALALGGALLAAGLGPRPAAAQSTPAFRIEQDVDAPARGSVVVGYVYNEGRRAVGLVRLRAEVLDPDGKVIGEGLGWVYGNIMPGGRGYFRIAVPTTSGRYRFQVVSFVNQSTEESP